MQIEGQYTFRAPLNAVWDALMDPAVLAQALPGGEELKRVGENEYLAVMNVRVGPVQGKFEGRIELADIDPLKGYRMKVAGQGAPGFVNGEGDVLLEAASDEAGELVLMSYRGDVQVGGKIAGVSQRLVESSAKSLTRQGLQALERQIATSLLPVEAVAAAAHHDAARTPMAAGAALPAGQALEAGSAPQAGVTGVTPAGDGASSGPAWQPVTTRRTVTGAPPPPARTSATSVMLTTARDVAGDIASDYISPAQQERLVWAGVGALAMLLFVVLVRLVQKR
jgi:carbon monoxide dehydrogenase subunit G